jgi:hypothetical protein
VRSFLAGWLPLLVAAALVLCLYSVREKLTRTGTWQRKVTWLLPLLAFVPVWFGGAALVISLVGGDLVENRHFDGSRGGVFWQKRSLVMLRMAGIERQWFEIKDDSGKRLAKADYVEWLVVQTDKVEVLGAGRDIVWLDGEKLGLHTRDLYTGKWLRGRKELLGDVVLAEMPFRYEPITHRLTVTTQSGRTLILK